MKLGPLLLKQLDRTFQPDTLVEMKFRRYDLSIKTDAQGRAIWLFIGQRNERGQIKGERFVRNLIVSKDGMIIKDHWDDKGKV